MSLATAHELVRTAYEQGYAVPAINTQGGHYDIMRAIVEAAEKERSPIILAAYEKNLDYYGFEWFGYYGSYLARRANVPVALHLDHGQSFDVVVRALRYGFTSVMIDYSKKPLEENIAVTQEVIRIAGPLGISVEAEIGELQRLDEQGEKAEPKNLVNPQDVKVFLQECRPDMLAAGIGNAHGFYKGEPNIRIDLLKEVKKVAGDVPLVLHGTTGIPEATVKECIHTGIAKVNYGTIVRHQYLEYYKAGLAGGVEHGGHSWRIAQYAKDRLIADVQNIIRITESGRRYR